MHSVVRAESFAIERVYGVLCFLRLCCGYSDTRLLDLGIGVVKALHIRRDRSCESVTY